MGGTVAVGLTLFCGVYFLIRHADKPSNRVLFLCTRWIIAPTRISLWETLPARAAKVIHCAVSDWGQLFYSQFACSLTRRNTIALSTGLADHFWCLAHKKEWELFSPGMEELYPKGIQWHLVRMLSIDELKVSILLQGDNEPRQYEFESREQMERVMRRWFGSAWTREPHKDITAPENGAGRSSFLVPCKKVIHHLARVNGRPSERCLRGILPIQKKRRPLLSGIRYFSTGGDGCGEPVRIQYSTRIESAFLRRRNPQQQSYFQIDIALITLKNSQAIRE